MAHIFLSYVEEDESTAQEIARRLEAAGHQVWYYQRDSLPVASYLQQTRQAIEECGAFVLLVSTHSLTSNQVDKEVVRAHECGKLIVPVLTGVSHADFERLRPDWDQAAGSVTSVQIPPQGVAAVVPRILRGLALALPGVAANAVGGAGAGTAPARAQPEPVPFIPTEPARMGARSYFLRAFFGLLIILFTCFLVLGLFIKDDGSDSSLWPLSLLAILGIWPGLYLLTDAIVRAGRRSRWAAVVLWVAGGMFLITGLSTQPGASGEPPREVPLCEAALMFVAASAVSSGRLRSLLRLPH